MGEQSTEVKSPVPPENKANLYSDTHVSSPTKGARIGGGYLNKFSKAEPVQGHMLRRGRRQQNSDCDDISDLTSIPEERVGASRGLRSQPKSQPHNESHALPRLPISADGVVKSDRVIANREHTPNSTPATERFVLYHYTL